MPFLLFVRLDAALVELVAPMER